MRFVRVPHSPIADNQPRPREHYRRKSQVHVSLGSRTDRMPALRETIIFIDCRMISASAMQVKKFVSDTNVSNSN